MVSNYENKETPIIKRPILRYHGGKWNLAPWIISYFPRHRIYVEPFCGAANLLLRKPRSDVEVLNDKYERIVSCFRVLRDQETAKQLQRRLRYTPYSYIEYYAARERHPDPIEDARRLIILGHQAHGSTGSSGGKLSGWRRGVRSHGPHSAKEWAMLWEYIDMWADRLRGVYLECDEAINVIKRWDSSDTLFYIDPPYVPETRSFSLKGYAYEMTDDDHRNLAYVLQGLKGKVILSGYPCDLYDKELYENWFRVSVVTTTDKARKVKEVLWMNFKPAQKTLFA